MQETSSTRVIDEMACTRFNRFMEPHECLKLKQNKNQAKADLFLLAPPLSFFRGRTGQSVKRNMEADGILILKTICKRRTAPFFVPAS